LKRYAAAFDLNIVHSVTVKATSYDETQKEWTVRISTPEGDKTIVCKHLVQATGICSAKPNIPQISDPQLYKGISLHSTSYKNPKLLIDRGAKASPMPLINMENVSDTNN
jgi:cation diffusion facilitator CzcD-associated flavoprotein CzcO